MSRTYRLLAIHFAALAFGVHMMARAVDEHEPGTARVVFVHLVLLGVGIGWVLRGAVVRRQLARELARVDAEIERMLRE